MAGTLSPTCSMQDSPSIAEPQRLGRLGTLTTRFAATEREIEAAFRLRHAVFVQEMGARPSFDAGDRERGNLERDAHDAQCRHLLVLDEEDVVGTYRIVSAIAGDGAARFYSASEFDLAPLLSASAGKQVMEFGRSCIARPYRTRRTMELLWHGAWATAVADNVAVMFGCASLPGIEIEDHRESFAWLAEHALAEPERDCPAAFDGIDMRDAQTELTSRTFAKLPPVIKGYLRLGAKVASHAVRDVAFGTTDVLIVLDVSAIAPRYLAHYGKQATRFAV